MCIRVYDIDTHVYAGTDLVNLKLGGTLLGVPAFIQLRNVATAARENL